MKNQNKNTKQQKINVNVLMLNIIGSANICGVKELIIRITLKNGFNLQNKLRSK